MNDDSINNIREHELIFKIHRVKDDRDEWMPAIEDIKSHDITPVWAAGLAYVILDRYLSCIDESMQHDFQDQVMYWLEKMLKDNNGSEYVDKINIPDSMD